MIQRMLGEVTAQLARVRRLAWVDLVLVIGLAGLLFAFIDLGQEWTGVHRPSIEIDLSPWALPRYTLYSLFRGLFAYVISLSFTLVYGYWAAKDRVAGRVLIPLLDVLQSIPVLGFMPGLVLALVALFPGSNIGLELAAVIMIFTGQAWNMTFSFYHSLRSIPLDLREAATVYRFGWAQRLRQVELPFAAMGLVWNSMMSMAGGWFFLMINEAFQLGERDFRLPGVGSYMSVAVEQGRGDAMLLAVLAMAVMIVLLDQLLWRPVVVWAQKFRVEEFGHEQAMRSWFLDWLRRSHLVRAARAVFQRARINSDASPIAASPRRRNGVSPTAAAARLSGLALALLLALLGYGAWKLIYLLKDVAPTAWAGSLSAGLITVRSCAVGVFCISPRGGERMRRREDVEQHLVRSRRLDGRGVARESDLDPRRDLGGAGRDLPRGPGWEPAAFPNE